MQAPVFLGRSHIVPSVFYAYEMTLQVSGIYYIVLTRYIAALTMKHTTQELRTFVVKCPAYPIIIYHV